ncbi:hypothetical protein V8F20_011456 [Naviculisporaceae sp. PSN 640]
MAAPQPPQNPLAQLRDRQKGARQWQRKLVQWGRTVGQSQDDPDLDDLANNPIPARMTLHATATPEVKYGTPPDDYGATPIIPWRWHEYGDDFRLGTKQPIRNLPGQRWRKAGNAVREMARVLAQGTDPTRPRLRFVKLLGAGGLGFVALFDARDETPGQHGQPWHVNLYVCKGALRFRVISRRNDNPGAAEARRKYREAVKDLIQERTNQEVSGNNERLKYQGPLTIPRTINRPSREIFT